MLAATAPLIFAELCLRCHAVEGRGGAVGPELGWIALTRTLAQLRVAIEDPGAEVFREYTAAEVGGVEGIVLNEDEDSIQLRLADGSLRSLPRAGVRRTKRSPMPSFAGLPAAERAALLAYLRTLRGPPVVAAPRTRIPARLAESQAWMTRPEREAEEMPEAVLDAMGLGAGDVVADIGAGSGYFTWRLAKRVARVIAVDVQPEVLRLNEALVRSKGVAGRVAFAGELPAGLPFDAVLVANAFHEFAEPEAMLASIRRALTPGGKLMVLEYARERPGVPVGESHKMSLAELRAEIEPAGFRLERLLDFLPLQHGLILIPEK